MTPSTSAMPPDYLIAVRSSYEHAQSLGIGDSTPLAALIEAARASENPFVVWTEVYRSQARDILESSLRDLGAAEDSEFWRQATQLEFYERVLPAYISTWLLWIWEEDVALDGPDQARLVSAIFE